MMSLKNRDTNNSPKPSPKGYKSNWVFLLVMLLFIFSWLFFPSFKIKEIGWQQFEQTMLSQHDVAKILVINKNVAEIYIKQEKLKETKYQALANDLFASKIGPHYSITIGSVESFETKLEKAQEGFSSEDKIDILYKYCQG